MTKNGEKHNKNIDPAAVKSITEALKEVFGKGKESQKFIDISRIPLICQSIIGIHENLKDINVKLDNKFVTKESFSPVRNTVYGMIGIILTGVIIAIMSVVLKK